MERRTKYILLILIVIGLVAPLIQYQTRLITVKKLHGSFIKNPKPEFSFSSWFDNSFQNQYDSYFNQQFGFRPDFVRLHNQLDYTLFGETNANGVIVGKDEYLYEKAYIESYLGDNYIGNVKIISKLNTIDSIYQILKQHQTELLIIIAPGKGYFYPEYIPEEMLHERGRTNYEDYIEKLAKMDIPYIDFNDLFLKMKDTSSIVIYPKTGIHWSQGIIPYIMDTIIYKIENSLNKNLPNVIVNSVQISRKADKQDADIEKGLNLFLPLKIPKMQYPEVSFEFGTAYDKPKVISVADSYFWQLFNKGISTKVFDDGAFWYYYKQVYPNSLNGDLFIEDIAVRQELFKADLVILMCTETNLYKFPFGFENSMEYTKFDLPILETNTQNLMNYIRTDAAWMKHIEKKAAQNNIPVDSALFLDALFMTKKKMNWK